MIKILLVLLTMSLAHAQEFRVEQIRGIKIIGWKGQLSLFAEPKTDSVKYKFNSRSSMGGFNTSATVVDGWLELKVNGPSSKSDWRQEIPRIDLEVRCKAVPVVASWVEGDITVKSWNSPVQLTNKIGKIKIEDGQEAYKLSLHEGELDVVKFNGSLDIDNYSARLALRKLEGRTKIENFQGRLTIDESKGDVSLKSVQGKNTIEELQGNLDFENIKGEIMFAQGEGSVVGKSQGGIIDGRLRGPVEIRIRGEEARVNLQLQKGIGARVDVGTSKGGLATSLPLKSDRLENIKLLRGQINGSRSASVFVRLQSGDIRLR